MSKKFNVIKDAVFYAQQSPCKLAKLLESVVPDTLTSIVISGPTEITYETSKTQEYTTKGVSQFGDDMTATVTLALAEAVDGVDLSGNTITLSEGSAGKSFTLKATSGSITSTLTVNVVEA